MVARQPGNASSTNQLVMLPWLEKNLLKLKKQKQELAVPQFLEVYAVESVHAQQIP